MRSRAIFSICTLSIPWSTRTGELSPVSTSLFSWLSSRQLPTLQPKGQCRYLFRASTIRMMPEGPEVRSMIDQLQGHGVGHRLIDIQFLSGRYVRHGRPTGFEDFANTMTPLAPRTQPTNKSTLEKDVIHEWKTKGKFLYICLDDGNDEPPPTTLPGVNTIENNGDFQRSIWITLGMSGRFVPEPDHSEDPRFARWCLKLLNLQSGITNTIYYHDQRNFGTLQFSLSKRALQAKLDSLGNDILDKKGTTVSHFLEVFHAQRPTRNVCRFLMDQSKISGIGNYLLAEGLYRARIDPFASLQELDDEQATALFLELQSAAIESYHAQGHQRYRVATGNAIPLELQCYGREFCARGHPVIRHTNGPHKRTIWYTEQQLFHPLEERESTTTKKRTGVAPNTKEIPTKDALAMSTSGSSSWIGLDLAQGLSDHQGENQKINWRQALSGALQSESFQRLQQFLKDEHDAGATIYPPPDEIFAALNTCPLDQVKVVIVGQDPYHGPGQGHGLAFSVRRGVKIPPSLVNIIQELHDDPNVELSQHRCEPHGNLEHWASQGVLLLNSVLTVRRGKANSHAKRGWEDLTDAIIQVLNEREDGLVFLLWGNPAAKKARGVDSEKHVVIRTSHPSPLGARKTNAPFLGSRCFSRANQALASMTKTPIDWSIV